MSLRKKKHRFKHQPKKKLKVLIIHPSVGLKQSGAQIFVQEIAEVLKNDFEITVLSNKKENEIYKKIPCIPRTSNSFTWLKKMMLPFCSSPEIVLEHLSSLFPTWLEIVTNNYDIVFPNNDWGGLLACKFARPFRKFKLVFTEHCGLQNNGKIAKRNINFKADKYIILSDTFKEIYKEKRVNFSVIQNGVNLQKFNPEICPASLKIQKPIVCVVGRCSSDKRLDLTIKAVARLSNVSLLIISPDKSIELLELGESLLEDKFQMLKANYDEMPNLYRACDLFTLPSKEEPFGLVYIEAMACNLPVVAPDDKQRQNIIEEAGIFCDVENEKEYACSIKRALEFDWHYKPYFQAKKFTLDKTAKEYARVFENLL